MGWLMAHQPPNCSFWDFLKSLVSSSFFLAFSFYSPGDSATPASRCSRRYGHHWQRSSPRLSVAWVWGWVGFWLVWVFVLFVLVCLVWVGVGWGHCWSVWFDSISVQEEDRTLRTTMFHLLSFGSWKRSRGFWVSASVLFFSSLRFHRGWDFAILELPGEHGEMKWDEGSKRPKQAF